MNDRDGRGEETPAWGGRIVQIGASILCILLLVWLVDLEGLVDSLSGAKAEIVGLAVLVAFCDRFLMIIKWYPLLLVQAPQIRLGAATQSYFAATFANYLLPSTVGPDALRAASLGRPYDRTMEVGASIVAERLLGMLANGVLVMVSAIVAMQYAVPVGGAITLAVALFGLVLVITVAPFSPHVRSWVRSLAPDSLLERHDSLARRMFRSYMEYRHYPRVLAIVGLLTLVEVCAPVLIVWILSHALGLDMPLPALIVSVPIAQLVAKIPISFAGLGMLEGSLVSLLVVFGISAENALAVAALLRATDIAVSIPGAFLMTDLTRGMLSRKATSP